MSNTCEACGQGLPYEQEPPDRSIVLDRHGDAWQRRGFWDCVESDEDFQDLTWQALNKEYGPIKVVYTS